jgi:hypothetical protein
MNVHSTSNTQEQNLTETSLDISFKSANTSFLNTKNVDVKIHGTSKSECAQKSYPKTLSQPYTMLLPVWPPNLRATEGSKIHTFECSVLGLQYKTLYRIIKGRGLRKLSKYFTQNIEMSRRKLCTIHNKFNKILIPAMSV